VFAIVHQRLIDAFGWRGAWAASGVIAILIIAPVALLFIRRTPEDMGLRPDGEATPTASARGTAAQTARETVWTPKAALRTAALWQVVVAYALLGFAMGGFIVHRFPFWVDKGLPEHLVALSYSIDAAVFGIGTATAGPLCDRFPVRYVAATAIGIQLTGVVLTIVGNGSLAMFASASVFGIGAGTGIVIQQYIWPAYFGRSFLGTIRGIVLPTSLVANGLGPPFLGFMFDRLGSYDAAFWMVAGLTVAAMVTMFIAKPPRPRAGLTGAVPAPASTG